MGTRKKGSNTFTILLFVGCFFVMAESLSEESSEDDLVSMESTRSSRFLRWPSLSQKRPPIRIKKRLGPLPPQNFDPKIRLHKQPKLPLRGNPKVYQKMARKGPLGVAPLKRNPPPAPLKPLRQKQPLKMQRLAPKQKKVPRKIPLPKGPPQAIYKKKAPLLLIKNKQVLDVQKNQKKQGLPADDRFFFPRRNKKKQRKRRPSHKRPKTTKRPTKKTTQKPVTYKPVTTTYKPQYDVEVTSYKPPQEVYRPSANVDSFPDFPKPDFPDLSSDFMPDFNFEINKINFKEALDGTDSYKPPSYEAPSSYDPPSYSYKSKPQTYSRPVYNVEPATYKVEPVGYKIEPIPTTSYKPPTTYPPYKPPETSSYPSYKPPETSSLPSYYKYESSSFKNDVDFDIKTPKYAVPSFEPPSLTYDREPSYVPSAPKYSPASYKTPDYSFNDYKLPEVFTTAPNYKYKARPRPTYPTIPTTYTTSTTVKTTTAPKYTYEDSYGYSPYEPETYEQPDSYQDSYGYEQPQEYKNGYFDSSYREPIQPLYEQSYEPQPTTRYTTTTTTTTTTPTTTTRYTTPTTTTTTTQLSTEEYTPGPIYYKPLPPVNTQPQKMNVYNPYDTIYYTPAPQAKEAVPSTHNNEVSNYPAEPNLFDTPSIYDDIEDEEMLREYPDEMDDTPVIEMVEMAEQPLMLEEQDPTQRSYLDLFYDDEEYEDTQNSSSGDNTGFFSSPNFRNGVMPPDMWSMFNSDWGQKVQ